VLKASRSVRDNDVCCGWSATQPRSIVSLFNPFFIRG